MACSSPRQWPAGGLIDNLIRIAAAGALLACSASTPAAGPSSAMLAAALETYAAVAAQPLPQPDAAQLDAIAAGETLSLRRYIDVADAQGHSQQRILVTGYQWVPRPRLLVWLATLDVNTRHSDALTEHLLSVDDRGGAVWYQHMNLPWPMRNRHWMIQSHKNRSVAAATDGLIWEHAWRLADDGPSRSQALLASGAVEGLSARAGRRAIYLTFNRGAWTMIDLGDANTLVITHALAVMGGWIPEEWVAGFVARQLGHVLQNLAGRADTIHAGYRAQPPVFSGAGAPIQRPLALEAWRDYSTLRSQQGNPAAGPHPAADPSP